MRSVLALLAFGFSSLLLPFAATAQPKPSKADIDLSVPDAIKPTGAHGTVVLEGDIGADGNVANLQVTKTSRSEELDKFALERFAHARIGEDLKKDGATRVQLTVKIYNARALDFGRYGCQQAVLDADWYQRTFETSDNEYSELYLFIQAGGNILARPELAFAKDRGRYDRVLRDTIESCRKTPEANWFATLVRLGRDAK
jgi:TonB family protein